MTARWTVSRLLVVAATVAAVAVPSAAADAVYHTEHLDLSAVAGSPLRSGFVQNIKAQGPRVYAHELVVLNGARPNESYSVTRNFFFRNPGCDGLPDFASEVATLETNAAGNGRADLFVAPDDVAGLEGLHGVSWTLTDAVGVDAYRTDCAAVTLD